MTIKELKESLAFFPDDKEVVIAVPSGDYWGTTKAINVSEVAFGNVTWSSYHNTDKIVDDENIDNYEKDELKEVVVLS